MGGGKLNTSKILRQKAEELLKKKQSGKGSQHSEADTQKFMHEFEVHQIELDLCRAAPESQIGDDDMEEGWFARAGFSGD